MAAFAPPIRGRFWTRLYAKPITPHQAGFIAGRWIPVNCTTRHSYPISPTWASARGRRAISSLPSVTAVRYSNQSQSRTTTWSHVRRISSKQDQVTKNSQTTTTASTRTSTQTPAPSLPKLRERLTLTPHENIYTIPNILTFSRLASAPLIGYFILTSQPFYALALFVYAGFTDALDGYIARRFSQQTVVGTVIDPMADKALMTFSVVALAMQPATTLGSIPIWLAVIILGRDVALAISAIYFRWISLPPPKTMRRYWDFSLPSAEVRPTEISKINTFLQLLLVGGGLVLPVLPEAFIATWHLTQGFAAFQYVVATTTIWSGASYIYSKDAVKILTKAEIEERSKLKK